MKKKKKGVKNERATNNAQADAAAEQKPRKKSLYVRIKERYYTKIDPLFHEMEDKVREIKLKIRINPTLIVGTILIVGLGVFFLTSKMFMPDVEELNVTELGTQVEVSRYTDLQLKRWDYSRRQNKMEIELKVDSKNVHTTFYCHVKDSVSGKFYPTQIVYHENGILIVQADVKRVKRMRLVVATKENEEIEKASGQTEFFTDYRVLNEVENIQVQDSDTYFRMSIESDIQILRDQIRKHEDQIASLNSLISDSNTLIFDRQELMKNQTTLEKKNSEEFIKKEKVTIANYEKGVVTEKEKIAEGRQEIKEKEEILGQF